MEVAAAEEDAAGPAEAAAPGLVELLSAILFRVRSGFRTAFAASLLSSSTGVEGEEEGEKTPVACSLSVA